jgi:hypothetical protein
MFGRIWSDIADLVWGVIFLRPGGGGGDPDPESLWTDKSSWVDADQWGD